MFLDKREGESVGELSFLVSFSCFCATGSGCEVRAYRLVPLGKRIAHEPAERLKRGVVDPVTGEEAVPPARDQALFEEQGQVFAGIGL